MVHRPKNWVAEQQCSATVISPEHNYTHKCVQYIEGDDTVKPKVSIGGQAVIEGVMMRGPGLIATAVREPSGEIIVKTENFVPISDIYPILKKPMVRGVVALVEAGVSGHRTAYLAVQLLRSVSSS